MCSRGNASQNPTLQGCCSHRMYEISETKGYGLLRKCQMPERAGLRSWRACVMFVMGLVLASGVGLAAAEDGPVGLWKSSWRNVVSREHGGVG